MHPHIKNDAALRKILAPRRPRSQAGGALDGERGEPSEPPGAYDLARAHDGRVEAELVGDAQDHAGVVAGSDHLTRMRHTQRERLLAQYVLLPARGSEHGGVMQRVRQGDVDRVDAGVMHQGLEVAVDALNAEALREHAPLLERAAEAGGEPRARALDHGRGDEIGRDPAETDDAPAYRGLCAA